MFAGAVGKSAQFPLHVWLPDAMEGPTPVCALIHAATMVNAGVYFVARANPLFAQRAQAMVVVAAIGIFTAILAASIAFTQTDIKRVLAYSTLSQLGYMFAALGVGAFTAAIFHLMTHGFFKGLLFLGSGSVIHAVHEEQDMNRMGGLWQKIPITHWTMLIGAHRDRRHPAAGRLLQQGRDPGRGVQARLPWRLGIGVVVAMMTAFYMFRLMGKTFYGREPRRPGGRAEDPRVATVDDRAADPAGHPVGLPGHRPVGPAASATSSADHEWLEPVFAQRRGASAQRARFQFFGIDGALIIVERRGRRARHGRRQLVLRLLRPRPRRPRSSASDRAAHPFLYRASLNKWWFDDLNDLLFVAHRRRGRREPCGGSTATSSTARSTASAR